MSMANISIKYNKQMEYKTRFNPLIDFQIIFFLSDNKYIVYSNTKDRK